MAKLIDGTEIFTISTRCFDSDVLGCKRNDQYAVIAIQDKGGVIVDAFVKSREDLQTLGDQINAVLERTPTGEQGHTPGADDLDALDAYLSEGGKPSVQNAVDLLNLARETATERDRLLESSKALADALNAVFDDCKDIDTDAELSFKVGGQVCDALMKAKGEG